MENLDQVTDEQIQAVLERFGELIPDPVRYPRVFVYYLNLLGLQDSHDATATPPCKTND